MFKQFRIPSTALLLVLIIFVTGCDLNITNPNQASEEQVLTTAEGIESLGVGIQQYYATTALSATILDPGKSGRELGTTTTLQNHIDLEVGGEQLPQTNPNVLRVWSRNYRVIGMAEDLIENTPEVPITEGMESGILALAHMMKGVALGNIIQNFEEAPITTDRLDDVPFHDRQTVLNEALAQLDEAASILSATPPSDAFFNRVLSASLDLENTVDAYRARYHLLLGNNNDAISYASQVNQSVASMWEFDAEQSRNPIHNQVFELGYYGPIDNLGLEEIEEDDNRVSFFLTGEQSTSSGPSAFPLRDLTGFFDSPDADIPAYMPGEMELIQAEAHLNMGNLDQAVEHIDNIRTKSPGEDPLGVGANLDPYDGEMTEDAIRDELFQQRRAELFMQGFGLEDSRRLQPDRLDTGSPFARNRNFYPYPEQEHLNNPNTPSNPGI